MKIAGGLGLGIALLLSACGGTSAPNPAGKSSQFLATTTSVAPDYGPLVQQLYVSYFGRPADTGGLANFKAQLASLGAPTDLQQLNIAYAANPAIKALIDSFGGSAESAALYSGDNESFIKAIYANQLNRSPYAEGLAYWVGNLNSGTLSRANASLSIMAGALVNPSAQGKLDAAVINNKIFVAGNFTAAVLNSVTDGYAGGTAAGQARTLLTGVTGTTDTAALLATVTALAATMADTRFAQMGAAARASILADVPLSSVRTTVNYLYESGVPQQNRDLIKGQVDNYLGRFSTLLGTAGKPITFIEYSSLAGGQALAISHDPTNTGYVDDMARTFPTKPDPALTPCKDVGGFTGGFSVGYNRVIVIGAACATNTVAAANTAPHELTHSVQSSVLNGANPREFLPVWLVEGQPNVVANVMSVRNGADDFIVGRAARTSAIPRNRTVADLIAMEGETSGSSDAAIRGSEYIVGAALTEYLIGRSGFNKSLELLRQAQSLAMGVGVPAAQIMVNFRAAFQTTYGQTLDAFYAEALPYINYLSTHSPTASAASTEPGTKVFLTEGCHGMVDATLQKQAGSTWVDVAAAKGWDIAPTSACLEGTYRPWTIAEIPKGTVLRWYVYSTGRFDWYSPSITY